MKHPRWVSLLEVTLFYMLAMWVIWWGGEWRPTILLVALVMLIICIGSNLWHHDSLEKIGLARRNFWPSMKIVLPITVPLLFPLIIFAIFKKSPSSWDWKFNLLGYPVWSFVQEYVLLSFFANRLDEAIPQKTLIPWLNGFLFGLAHLPNPVLTVVTFISGVLFTHLFFKKRHLIALALMHALFGIVISLAFGDIYGIMSVGPAYLKRIGNPIIGP